MPEEKTKQWQGRKVVGRDGNRIGTVGDLYVDSATGEPEWILVNTGLFGTRGSFVPLRQAAEQGDEIQVPYDKRHVSAAPNIEPDGTLDPEEERRLYRHYGFGAGGPAEGRAEGEGTAGRTDLADTREAAGYEREAREPTGTDEAMTRSEEELRVRTEWQERGRVRLRKHVVTEQVSRTVPVRREEVRLEREPITEANRDAAMAGPELRDSEHEVVIHEEEAIVEKRVVPKERVWLGTQTVTEERTITDELRKEQIEMDELDRPRRQSR